LHAVESPKANPESLLTIVSQAHDAKIVLPEFQRSFVWAREDIEQLLASVLQGYFVGTFLLLDTPTSSPMFPFRVVEGLEKVNGNAHPSQHATVRLVLDGQQRITSLFYALYEPEIPLRWAQYPHKFYLRLDLAREGDLDEAVVGISTRDRRRMTEIQQLVKDNLALPFSLLRDSSRFYHWLYTEQGRWVSKEERVFIEGLYHRLHQFMVPVVTLSAETGKANVVNIFERINRTGVSLSLFDLTAAHLYLKGVKLREMWEDFEQSHREIKDTVKPEFLLKVIAVFQGKEPRKGNLLDVIDDLPAETFRDRWSEAVQAIAAAYGRIRDCYGAFDQAWIPYTTILVPLAVLLHQFKKINAGETAYRCLDRWYWSSVFSQRYDSAVDTRTYQDAREIGAWAVGQGSLPEWIRRLTATDLDLAVDERRSAVYRGIMCLIAREGARDFLTGQPARLHECQDDHIFPRSVYGQNHPADIVVNRTFISKETNNRKANRKPSEFLRECLAGHGQEESRLLATLQTHFISPQAYEALMRDDFDTFVALRGETLRQAVSRALSGESPKSSTH
jgi:hypothetical protein